MLEQLLKFSTNSGNLWTPAWGYSHFPALRPAQSPGDFPKVGRCHGTSSFAATAEEGLFDLEQEQANGSTTLRLELWWSEHILG